MDSKKLALLCRELADNKKAEDILVLDVRKLSSVTDYFVIASGTSQPHLRAIRAIACHDLLHAALRGLGEDVLRGRQAEGHHVLAPVRDVGLPLRPRHLRHVGGMVHGLGVGDAGQGQQGRGDEGGFAHEGVLRKGCIDSARTRTARHMIPITRPSR